MITNSRGATPATRHRLPPPMPGFVTSSPSCIYAVLLKQPPGDGIPNPFPWSLPSPPALGGGYVCLVVAIFVIGVLTAVIGDIANHMGCTIYLKDSVTATTIVALGTSMPGNADSL